MVSTLRSPSLEALGRLLGVLAVLSTSLVAVRLLLPAPLADVFFTAWVVFAVGVALVGAIGAWTNRTPLVWVAALLLTGFSVVAILSIGFFIAPAALLLLGSALMLQLAGPRTDRREAIAADPPAVQEVTLKALAGIGSVAIGGWLVYVGAFTQELFGACASETLDCALARTHWDAVGLTVLGLVAVGVGGWLLWKQVYVARVLGSEHVG